MPYWISKRSSMASTYDTFSEGTLGSFRFATERNVASSLCQHRKSAAENIMDVLKICSSQRRFI